jgi:type VI secretion system protein ImpF
MAGRPIEVRMPLFDRLVDRTRSRIPHPDKVQMRTIDRGALKKSVRRELEQLFNTRCPIPAHLLGARPRTVIDYGVPDFSTISARNVADRARLAAMLRSAVEAYEPRLANVRVEVHLFSASDRVSELQIERIADGTLLAVVHGDLVVDGVPEAVLFTTALQTSEGSVAVR